MMKASSKMATETLSRNEIDNAARTLAIRTLGIDVDAYRRAINDAVECMEATALLSASLKQGDRGLALLLDGIRGRLELVSEELNITGRAMGIEAVNG